MYLLETGPCHFPAAPVHLYPTTQFFFVLLMCVTSSTYQQTQQDRGNLLCENAPLENEK